MPQFPHFCRMSLKSSAQMVNFTTNPSYRQPIYKLTLRFPLVHGAKPFSCFGTRLNNHSWLFFRTSSKHHKTPANLVSQILAVFAAVQKISWLSMQPVVVLVWQTCFAVLCRRDPTWGPRRSQTRLDETVGNTSYNCIKIWTWRKKTFLFSSLKQPGVQTGGECGESWKQLSPRGPRSISYYWGISPGTS